MSPQVRGPEFRCRHDDSVLTFRGRYAGLPVQGLRAGEPIYRCPTCGRRYVLVEGATLVEEDQIGSER